MRQFLAELEHDDERGDEKDPATHSEQARQESGGEPDEGGLHEAPRVVSAGGAEVSDTTECGTGSWTMRGLQCTDPLVSVAKPVRPGTLPRLAFRPWSTHRGPLVGGPARMVSRTTPGRSRLRGAPVGTRRVSIA